jgi:hypothetical protein
MMSLMLGDPRIQHLAEDFLAYKKRSSKLAVLSGMDNPVRRRYLLL